MTNIFIAHSPRDNQYLVALRDRLVRQGYTPWIDPAPRPGGDWRFEIDEAIRNSHAVILILTPYASDSVFVTYEWALALGLGKRVIPIIFKPTQIHPRLRTIETFDVTGFKDINQFWDFFSRELQRLIGSGYLQGAPAQPKTSMTNPRPRSATSRLNNEIDLSQSPPSNSRPNVMPQTPGHWIVIRRGPELHKMFKLEQSKITLGRDDNNAIVIYDAEISRKHLQFIWHNEQFYIEDLGSTNGTRINGKLIDEAIPLQSGQAIMLGDTIIISYEYVD